MDEQVETVWIGADLDSTKAVVALHAVGSRGTRMALDQFGARTYPLSAKGCTSLIKDVQAHLQLALPGAKPRLKVLAESTGLYSLQFSSWLCELDPTLRPAIVNAKQLKHYIESLTARPSKNDHNDARAIAQFGAERQPEPAPDMDADTLTLREIMRQRQSLIETLNVEENQALKGYTSAVVKSIAKRHVSFLKRAIAQLEKQARHLVSSNPSMLADANHMQQMTGVGELTAYTLLGELGDLRRFEDARQLAAYSGLSCKQQQSGKRKGKTTISKAGSASVRRALYMASLTAVMHDERFKASYDRLVQRGKHPRSARCAIMRKMLCTLRSMLIHSTSYDPNHLFVKNTTARSPSSC
jgi:transposase